VKTRGEATVDDLALSLSIWLTATSLFGICMVCPP
jgi:hypothetical protein